MGRTQWYTFLNLPCPEQDWHTRFQYTLTEEMYFSELGEEWKEGGKEGREEGRGRKEL